MLSSQVKVGREYGGGKGKILLPEEKCCRLGRTCEIILLGESLKADLYMSSCEG